MGIGFGYTIIFIILHLLYLFPSKSKRINQKECKDKIKCIRYTLKKVCERKYELMPMGFILFITLILSCMGICWDKSFNVSGPQIIVHMPFGLYTCAQELTTMSILFYISFWVVYKLRYLSQYLCDKLCYYGNNKLNGRFCNILKWLCESLYTLGSRLDIISTTRNDSNEMQEKAKVTRTFGTFLIGFCTIFISLNIFTNPEDYLSNFYLELIVGLQLIALILLIMGVDSFDSCLNKYLDKERALTYVKEYYSRGTRLFYISMEMIILSFLIIAFSINWTLTVSMVLIFLLLGYAYWFPDMYKDLEKPDGKPTSLCEHCQDKRGDKQIK